MAFAEDRAIFDGYAAAGIQGIRQGTGNPVMTLPADVREYPGAIAQALTQLRLAGVNGPYTAVLSADAYTAITPNQRPRLSGAGARRASSGQRGDHLGAGHRRRLRPLHARRRFRSALGQDISIGYVGHTDAAVRLYLQETFTFLLLTTEAAVALTPR